MKNIYTFFLIFILPVQIFSQEVIEKKDLNFNNYDNKYYNKGVPYSGTMKVKNQNGYYLITYKDGIINGEIKGYNNSEILSHKLKYSDGQFQGEFETPHVSGVFKNDTAIGLINVKEIFSNNQVGNNFIYNFNYTDTSNNFSKLFKKGKLQKQGILREGKLLYTSRYLGIQINNILIGEPTYFSVEDFFNPIDMHHLTTFYPESGKIKSKQLYNENCILTGEINYYASGKLMDSTSYLSPFNDCKSKQKNSEIFKKKYNKFYISYFENGNVKEKYTEMLNSEIDDNVGIEMIEVSTKNINEKETHFKNGNTQYKLFYNEYGKIQGDFISYYESGKIMFKALMENGECKMPFFYYRPTGVLRYSITKDENNEWLYQEMMPDGFLKFKKTINTQELNAISNGLIRAHKIGYFSNESEPFTENDNILNDLINYNGRDW